MPVITGMLMSVKSASMSLVSRTLMASTPSDASKIWPMGSSHTLATRLIIVRIIAESSTMRMFSGRGPELATPWRSATLRSLRVH